MELPLTRLPATTFSGNSLTEIEDSTVISRINDLAKSQEGGGQLRAFTRGQKGKTIAKNANVTPVDMKNMAEA